MKKCGKIFALAALSFSLLLHADESSDYCQWLEGKARSEKAVLQWPSLGASYSHRIRGDSILDEQIYTSQATLGLQFSPVGFYQGWLISDLSKSECQRYASSLKIDTILKYADHLDGGAGLTEEIKILKEAQAKASEILLSYEKLFQDKVITLPELYEIKSRVEAMAGNLFTAENEMAKLSALPAFPKESAATLISSYLKADEETESLEAAQRKTSAWIFNLRADAERYVAVNESTNFVGTINLGFKLGGLFQGGADSDALEARKRLAKKSVSLSPAVKLSSLRNNISKNLETEKKRLVEITSLTNFLKGRIAALKNAGTLHSKRMADSYWLDMLRYDAQAANLKSRIEAMSVFLNGNSTSP